MFSPQNQHPRKARRPRAGFEKMRAPRRTLCCNMMRERNLQLDAREPWMWEGGGRGRGRRNAHVGFVGTIHEPPPAQRSTAGDANAKAAEASNSRIPLVAYRTDSFKPHAACCHPKRCGAKTRRRLHQLHLEAAARAYRHCNSNGHQCK